MPAGFRVIVMLAGLLGAASAEPTSVAGFVSAARDADIVILGEIHDNPAHHRNQAEIGAALQPAALVMEMIPQAAEDEVNALRAAGAGREEIAAALDWNASGWPDFAHYAAILEAAPKAQAHRNSSLATRRRRRLRSYRSTLWVRNPDSSR